MSSLLVVKGYNIGVRYELGELTRLGRGPDNDLQLMDRAISRQHCEIARQPAPEGRGNLFVLTDCDSRDGTLVNGQLIEAPVALRQSDMVTLGAVSLAFDANYRIKNPRIGGQSVVLGAMRESTAVSWSATLNRLPRMPLPEGLQALRKEVEKTPGDPEALDQLLRRIAQVFQAAGAAVLLDDAGRAERPADDALILLNAVARDDLLPVDTPVVRRVIAERLAMEKHDVAVDEGLAATMQALRVTGLGDRRRSLLCVPILAPDGAPRRALGALYLDKYAAGAFGPEDAARLQTASHLLAPLVQLFALDGATPAAAENAGETGEGGERFLGESPQASALLAAARRLAETVETVLIQGEPGVGKELFAHELHRLGPRRKGPFVVFRCALDAAEELFGREERGAGGPPKIVRGKLELAHGGTLFLDGIDALGESAQAQLLRYLQDRAFNRAGGAKPLEADVRIVAATRRDRAQPKHEGAFRWDLLFKRDVAEVHIPPLRERPEDLRLLTGEFVARACRTQGRSLIGVSAGAHRKLESYGWPGNVRELRGCLERAVILGEFICAESETLGPETILLPGAAERDYHAAHGAGAAPDGGAFQSLREVERRHIQAVLEGVDWNQVRAADVLQIHRNTLRRKIQEYQLDARN